MVEVAIVLGHPEIPPGIELLHSLEELGVHRHQILKVSVARAVLLHVDPAVALHDAGFDLPRLSLNQDLPVLSSLHDGGANLQHALGAEGIGFPRKSQRGLAPLVALQERSRRPVRLDPLLGHHAIRGLEGVPGGVGQVMRDRPDHPSGGAAPLGRRLHLRRADLLNVDGADGLTGRALLSLLLLFMENGGLTHDPTPFLLSPAREPENRDPRIRRATPGSARFRPGGGKGGRAGRNAPYRIHVTRNQWRPKRHP